MKKINTAFGYVISIHLLGLLFMFIGRVVFLIANGQYLENIETKVSWTTHAFLLGMWFDNVIASYISGLPLALLALNAFFNNIGEKLLKIFNIYYIVIYTLVFGISIANVPYFSYFFRHLNSSILNWNEEVAANSSMLLQEDSYSIYFILFFILALLFAFLTIRISRRFLARPQINLSPKDYLIYIPVFALLGSLCFLGIRGRFGYNPIRTSQAYFTNNSFINQLGLNPTFYLLRDIYDISKSYFDPDKLMPEKEAITYVQKQLKIETGNDRSPIARKIPASGEPKEMNVVIILMESMSADLLSLKENGQELTPYLNDLIEDSYYFENFFSAGIHTNHGILATLYGMPSLLDKNMMKSAHIPLCQGIPSILQERGYETMLFLTHESQYDNINAFVLENGIEEVYSEETYPASKRVNSWGVADDYLFEFALDKCNEKSKADNPFFAAILTTSNHPPYVVPERYKKISDDPQFQILAFADDALRQFMEGAAEQDWYENTLFVLLGDHGKLVGNQKYDMPLSYNHIPLIIHSPVLDDAPRSFQQFGGQIDVFPTVMGLLNQPYINNTLGVDLFREERPCMFFSSDDAIGCINDEYFFSYNLKMKRKSLYRYNDHDPQNLAQDLPEKTDNMYAYPAAMLRVTSSMFKNNQTRVVF